MVHWLDKPLIGKAINKNPSWVPVDVPFDWDKEPPKKPIPGVTTIRQPVSTRAVTDKKKLSQALFIRGLLKETGLVNPVLTWAVAQCYFETNAWKNNGYLKYNNASGIKFAGQRGASKGPNGYAIFVNWQYWAKAMYHELTKGTHPYWATSVEEYVDRLKSNGYFESSAVNYLNGINNALRILGEIPKNLKTGYDTHSENYNPEDTNKGLKWWQWGLIGVGGLIIVKKVIE